jgi:hypothetical protein
VTSGRPQQSLEGDELDRAFETVVSGAPVPIRATRPSAESPK